MSRDLATCTVCGEEEGGDEYGCEQAIDCPHCVSWMLPDDFTGVPRVTNLDCSGIYHENGLIFPHNFEYLDGCSHGCVCSDPNEDY